MKEQDELEKLFEYKGSFNPKHSRGLLGLDGRTAIPLPPAEKQRIATMLWNNG